MDIRHAYHCGLMGRKIRCAHKWGSGGWFDGSEIESIKAWVKLGNDKHGKGTHWVEYDNIKEPTQ